MKHGLICTFLFALVVLTSCSNSDNQDSIKIDEIAAIAVKPFSDSLKTDTFRVKLMGTEPKEMYLSFTITSFEGKKIYDIRINAKELFKNYDVKNLNKKKTQIKFLKDEVDRFLDDENFMEPAVTDQESPDANVPDKSFYEELKKSQLNGFIYRLGKEQKRYIGWSQRDKKVRPYYSCCK